MRFVMALILLVGTAGAEVPALRYDHEVLLSLVQSKEKEARIVYTDERVRITTRRSVLVGWTDVVLSARFERRGDRVQLILKSLRAMNMEQKGKRFEEAAAGLLKLVNVKTAAGLVEIRETAKDNTVKVHMFLVIEQ